MRINGVIILTFIVLLMVSCGHVYKEYDSKSFPKYVWESGQVISFHPKIEDTGNPYRLILSMRHVYGLPLKSVTVNIKQISPSGKETVKEVVFAIKDSENQYIGSCVVDICDVETVIEETVTYQETGEYQYLITHVVPQGSIFGILGLGLIINQK